MTQPVGKEERDAWVDADSDLFWLSEHGALKGVAHILKERRRQIETLGWTAEHDDGHTDGELAATAFRCLEEVFESRDSGHGEPGEEKGLLRSAGALTAAEIDRLCREMKKKGSGR